MSHRDCETVRTLSALFSLLTQRVSEFSVSHSLCDSLMFCLTESHIRVHSKSASYCPVCSVQHDSCTAQAPPMRDSKDDQLHTSVTLSCRRLRRKGVLVRGDPMPPGVGAAALAKPFSSRRLPPGETWPSPYA